MTIKEEQLKIWIKPWYDKEEELAKATSSRVREALNKHPELSNLGIRVFPKGSYANNTNVRKDSDIDIAVELTDLIHFDCHDNLNMESVGLTPYTGVSANIFKQYVKNALISEFGVSKVDTTGNKVFKLRGSTAIMDSDIIPCTSYREYFSWGHRQGIQLILNVPDFKENVNFPEQHYNNGVEKNKNTLKRYKNIVRILKNARNKMEANNSHINYPSFMLESIAYNIGTGTYLYGDPWTEVLKDFCNDAWAYLKLPEPQTSSKWVEVNDIKYLFHSHQKWTREDAKNFIIDFYKLVFD